MPRQRASARLEPAAMLAATRAIGRHANATDLSVIALRALLYAGNLAANADLFVETPTTTDAPPIPEALAVRTQSKVTTLDAEEVGFVRAGEILYRALVAIDDGDEGEARRLRDAFRDLVPHGTYEMFASRLARADRDR